MLSIYDQGFLRVSCVSPELKVADTKFNTEKIIDLTKEISGKDAQIILFPELSITGYSCADLFYQESLLKSTIESLEHLKKESETLNSLLIVGAPIKVDDLLFNCAVLISNGNILGIIPKTYLPNYNEFYERRWFTSAKVNSHESIKINGQQVPFGTDIIFNSSDNKFKFGIEICEDLWSIIPPSSNMSLEGASVFFNLSASNELLGKSSYRNELVNSHSAKTISAYCYASSSPSESSSDLTYSSHLIISENGKTIDEKRDFDLNSSYIISEIDLEKIKSDRRIISTYKEKSDRSFRNIEFDIPNISKSELDNLPTRTPFVPSGTKDKSEVCDEILNIQSTALAKRLKHISCSSVTIGISGGLDSTLALLVTSSAFKKLKIDNSNINALVLPGPGSTTITQENAQLLSNLLGANYKFIDISEAVEKHLEDIDHQNHNFDITYENAQARERTQILMDYANKTNGIVIGTGDLSELALGWCTYNADQVSMYGVNAGVPKTLVKYLIDFEANNTEDQELAKTLRLIIDTPISPELIPADENNQIVQKTEDIIGPYELHDFFLYYFLRYGFAPKKIVFLANQVFKDFEKEQLLNYLEIFLMRFFASQFKRSLMPDGIKVGSVCLSPRGDWRMPSDASSKIWLDEIEQMKKEND